MKRQREIILLLTSILVMTILWIGFNLYHNAMSSTISEPLEKAIKPITPDFNTSTIQKLKERQYIAPLYEIQSASQIQQATGSLRQAEL